VALQRLNWGCGRVIKEGWVNSDSVDHGQDHVGDVLEGLPFADDHFDYAVAIHSLNAIPHVHQARAVKELARVLKPDGVLRISLPDTIAGFTAYLDGREDFWPDMEGEQSIDHKFCAWLTWYNSNLSIITYPLLEARVLTNGFARLERVAFGKTNSDHKGITLCDDRESESMFVEAVK
jgi:SAM-dependent methyltransferase